MDKFKRVLAILAILCMGGFVVSVLLLIFGMGNVTMAPWILGFLSVFLVLGGLALLINYLQKRAAQEKAQEQAGQENHQE